ncbi:MAG TPA: hypothetical protein PK054_06820 [Anaerohalosphaeraceae bacterium]|nr:hypothetical protein [Anaerohalosphaeraceae bacterium]HOL89547.1 hypothetical protein [Anaerohalosphaeraceae bacterium]HPP56281.1 hypothetical protein [Anaerohalosphaeraceae bacterium]
MAPDNNLDDDILQCRAEILRALGKTEGNAQAKEDESVDTDNLDTEDAFPGPDEGLTNLAEPPSQQSAESENEELNSKSGSFGDTAFELFEENPSDTPPVPSDAGDSPESSEKSASSGPEAKTLFFPKDFESLQKILHLLKEQKENLSQTCQEQEKHIAFLTEELEQLREKLQESQQTCSALGEENIHLKTIQKQTEQLTLRIQQMEGEIKELHQQISALKEENLRLLQEKTQLSEAIAAERQNRQTIENRQAANLQEINALLKKLDDLQITIASLNQENESLRQQNSSLHQQIHLLEQTIGKQQTESLNTIAALREELQDKSRQIETWKMEYDRLCEQIESERESDADFSASDTHTGESVFSTKEKETDSSVESAVFSEEDNEDFSIPHFDLSEQILSVQRKESSARRQPPSGGTAVPNESIRKVVHQFISTSQTDDSSCPAAAEENSFRSALEPVSFSRKAAAADADAVLSEIVRRDIERFCRNHQGVYIEFPSG